MTRRSATPRILTTTLAIFLVMAAVAAPACRRGGSLPTTRPWPVQPYPGYFQARVGDDIYLFATLADKTAFHGGSDAPLAFELFISRTGQRVFISSADPALVPRIELAYEQAMGMELAAFDPMLTPVDPATAPGQPSSLAPATRPAGEEQAGDD